MLIVCLQFLYFTFLHLILIYNYVVLVNDDSDEESEDSVGRFQRRKRRIVTQRQVNYHEISDTDSESKDAAPPVCKKPVSRLASRHLKDTDSEYQPSSDGDDCQVVVEPELEARTPTSRHKRVGLSSEESGSDKVSKKKGRLNRVIVSSSESVSSDSEDVKQTSCPSESTKLTDNGPNSAIVIDDAKELVVNGKNSNCNAESLNNRSFAIVNLLKTSSSTAAQSKQCAVASDTDVDASAVMIDDDDDLSGIDDIVNYVTQV